ncbi:MAG: carbon storage regulator [Planctomycetota bacterium]
MLVLSRRPGEKILFPSIGVSVEVIRTKGNTVRVGIEAPEDIRVLRGELEEQPKLNKSSESDSHLVDLNQVAGAQGDDYGSFKDLRRSELGQRIDDIVTALALAQNQQSQGLTDHAEIAIGEAMVRLAELRKSLSQQEKPDAFVCESKTAYQAKHATPIQHHGNQEIDHVLDRGFRFDFEFAV